MQNILTSQKQTWKYVLGGALIGDAIGGCIGYAVGIASAESGAVLLPGTGMDEAAAAYGNMASVFNSVELQIIAELDLNIIWHFVK